MEIVPEELDQLAEQYAEGVSTVSFDDFVRWAKAAGLMPGGPLVESFVLSDTGLRGEALQNVGRFVTWLKARGWLPAVPTCGFELESEGATDVVRMWVAVPVPAGMLQDAELPDAMRQFVAEQFRLQTRYDNQYAR